MKRRIQGKAIIDLIEKCLREGTSVDIDGLGSFSLNAEEQVTFEPNGRPRVFLAYAEEDKASVKKLFDCLRKAGFEPWMDQEKLLPGQNWPRAIEHAIEVSDFFVGCFSHESTVKHGFFQCELRYALDLASHAPLDDIFLVPVRLDECELPRHIARKTHWVDLFDDWEKGVATLTRMMHRQTADKKRRRKPAN